MEIAWRLMSSWTSDRTAGRKGLKQPKLDSKQLNLDVIEYISYKTSRTNWSFLRSLYYQTMEFITTRNGLCILYFGLVLEFDKFQFCYIWISKIKNHSPPHSPSSIAPQDGSGGKVLQVAGMFSATNGELTIESSRLSMESGIGTEMESESERWH